MSAQIAPRKSSVPGYPVINRHSADQNCTDGKFVKRFGSGNEKGRSRRTEMILCIEDFVRQVLTPAIQKLSSEEKREFREAWLAQYDRSSLRLTRDDVRWLRRIKIDPSGD